MSYNFLVNKDKKKEEFLDRITSQKFKDTINKIVAEYTNKTAAQTEPLTGICVEITSKCNKKCATCYFQNNSNNDIDDKLLNSLIVFANKQLLEVNLLGGEPLLHKNIMNIFNNLHTIIYFVTNATFFNETLSQEISNNFPNVIPVFSLDGFEEQNDGIRGKGSFKKTLDAINLTKKYGIPFRIISTITEKNIDEILGEKYQKFIESLEPLNLGIYKYRSIECDDFTLSQNSLKKMSEGLYQIENDSVFPLSHEEPRQINGTLQARKCRGLLTIGIDGEIKICPSINTGIKISPENIYAIYDILSNWYNIVGSKSNGCPLFYSKEKIKLFKSFINGETDVKKIIQKEKI